MSFANVGGGVGGVEPSERLLRLAKRDLWVICPLCACVKGCSDGTGKPDGKGGVELSRCRERFIFHSVLKNVSDLQVFPAERVLIIVLTNSKNVSI